MAVSSISDRKPIASVKTRICPKCRREKENMEFRPELGSEALCANCDVMRRVDKICARIKWEEENPKEAAQARHRAKNYGLTHEAYLQLLAKQKHRCAICLEAFEGTKRINVDHCHDTGKVRGLLCTRCNTRLALVEDTPALLPRMIGYLKEHGTWERCLQRGVVKKMDSPSKKS